MKFKTLLVFFGLFGPLVLSAQYLEVGISGGFAQYFGELQREYEPSENHIAFGAFARYNWSRRVAFKAHFLQTTLSGNDANHKAFNTFDFNRNLSFKSILLELGAQAEWNILKFDIREGKTSAPYFFGGVALNYFNPRAEIDGRWYNLQDLGTEGQTLEGGEKYSKLGLAFPVGAGLKISINERINVGFEIGYRFTLMDYLDDVGGFYPNLGDLEEINPIASKLSFRSPEILPQLAGNPVGKPRGNPNDKDAYFIGNITVSFNLAEGYDLEFDEHFKKFSPNYRPKKQSLKKVKRELKKEEKRGQ